MYKTNVNTFKRIISVVLEHATTVDGVDDETDYVEQGRAIWDNVIHRNWCDYLKPSRRYYLIRERTARHYARIVKGNDTTDYRTNPFIMKDLNAVETADQYIIDNGNPPPKYDIGDTVQFYSYVEHMHLVAKVMGYEYRNFHHHYRVMTKDGKFHSSQEINTQLWYAA